MEKNKWVKPFSTQLSCIDTISGECIQDITKEECQKICEASPNCHYGYHVRFPYKSYCLPINYINNLNENAWLDSMIDKKSIDFPYTEVTPFITSKYTYYPKNNFRYAYLKYDDYYLTKDLTFTKDKKSGIVLNILPKEEIFSSLILSKTDIMNGQIILIKDTNSNNVLGYGQHYIRWNTVYQYLSSDFLEDKFVFIFQIIQSYPFDHEPIDLNKKFALRIGNIPLRDDHIYYVTKNENNRLDTGPKMNMTDMMNGLEKYRQFNLEIIEIPDMKNNDFFINSQKKYINDFLPPPKKNKMNIPIIFLIILLIFQSFIFIYQLFGKNL